MSTPRIAPRKHTCIMYNTHTYICMSASCSPSRPNTRRHPRTRVYARKLAYPRGSSGAGGTPGGTWPPVFVCLLTWDREDVSTSSREGGGACSRTYMPLPSHPPASTHPPTYQQKQRTSSGVKSLWMVKSFLNSSTDGPAVVGVDGRGGKQEGRSSGSTLLSPFTHRYRQHGGQSKPPLRFYRQTHIHICVMYQARTY